MACIRGEWGEGGERTHILLEQLVRWEVKEGVGWREMIMEIMESLKCHNLRSLNFILLN